MMSEENDKGSAAGAGSGTDPNEANPDDRAKRPATSGKDGDPGYPTSGPGSTSDPNQANRTGLPRQSDERPQVSDEDEDQGHPTSGPGSTSDPNQANRT